MSHIRESNDDEPSNTPYTCSFPLCDRSYRHVTNLKQHLRNVRGGGFDKVHPENHEEWDRLAEFLKIQPRGKIFSHDIEQRRAEAQKKHYEKNKGKILEKHRQRRVKLYSTLSGLGSFADSILTKQQQMEIVNDIQYSIYEQMYGHRKLRREDFIDLSNPPTLDTYPRFVVWFLNPSQFPKIHDAILGVTLMFDVIPRDSHYRQVSALLHPDKNTDEDLQGLQTLLNAAFDLWRPVLESAELSTAITHAHDEASTNAFCQQGPMYKQLSQMYFCYMVAISDAAKFMNPQAISADQLSKTIFAVQEQNRIVKASARNGDEEIQLKEFIETAKSIRQNQKKGLTKMQGRVNNNNEAGRVTEVDSGKEQDCGRNESITRTTTRRGRAPATNPEVPSTMENIPSPRRTRLRRQK
jgi:hypothetical protein